jgi:hypothetical protein
MEPVAPSLMLTAVTAAALVILLGAAYAGLFALARLRGDRRLHALALVAYAGLAGAVALLGVSLGLDGAWRILVALMLIGYLIAPRAIWHLCTRTHGSQDG